MANCFSPPHASQVEEALTIKNTDIAKELCLPPVKLHCSSESTLWGQGGPGRGWGGGGGHTRVALLWWRNDDRSSVVTSLSL